MPYPFVPKTWENKPSTNTPIRASDLNRYEEQFEENTEDIHTLQGNVEDINQAISDLEENKVDKVEGKGLSTNDYTTTEKNNLANIKSEVENARQSAVKSKTFATVDARLEEIEQDNINTTTQLADTTNKVMLAHYDSDKGEYVGLNQFWNTLRTGKVYTTEFNNFSVSPSPIGTKLHDNIGLICEPSTNTYRGRNDYENIGLFKSIEVNAYVDENDDYHVTAIQGDGRFKRDGSNGDVYTMAMVGYFKYTKDASKWSISYSDAMHPGYNLLPGSKKIDGTIRPFMLYAKYVAGRNSLDGNKLGSISGVNPEFNSMSHNGQITEFKAKGTQYSGKTSHDDFYVQLMMWIKYATTNSQSIMQGCASYYLQYVAKVAETNTTRIIISNSEANNLVIGSCVSIGDYSGSTKTDDRSSALNTNRANRVKIISKEPMPDGLNTAIITNSPVPFDTTLTSTITTYPWKSGGCDNVLGTDGSPYNNQSGKEPFIINGIEMMVGGYEVLQNLIINNNNTGVYKIEVFACYDCKKYATSITSDYILVGELPITNNAWQYLSVIDIPTNHPSVILPKETNASSTTGFADGIYTNAPTSGTRVWRSLGGLGLGAAAGLRCLDAYYGLSGAYWGLLGRLSTTGRSG